MLPATTKADLARHLEAVQAQHHRDLAGWVELPTALLRKYPNAGRDWVWQWVFPAKRVYRNRLTGQRRRHHLHESVLQACGEGRGPPRWAPEARKPSHPAPLVRDAPARGRPRHPNRPGTAWAPGRDHHHDLHPRLESWAGRGPEPRRPDVRPTTPARSPANYTSRDTLRPIAAYPDPSRSVSPTTNGEFESRCAPSADQLPIAIRCKKPQPLPYYADRPIQWSNSS
jgi:hypothetical protein